MYRTRRRKFESSKHVEKRRKRTSLFVALFLVGATVLLIGLSWITHLEALAVQRIVVEGNNATNTHEIENVVNQVLEGEYVYFFKKSNSLIYPRQELEETLLKTFPRIEDVQVSLDSRDALYFLIDERKPRLLYCKGDEVRECFYVDKRGYIFSKAPIFSKNVFITLTSEHRTFGIGDTILSRDFFKTLDDFITELEKAGLRIEGVALKENGVIHFVLDSDDKRLEDSYIIADVESDFERVLDNLLIGFDNNSLADTEDAKSIKYIDVRFGDRLYINYHSSEE